MSSKVLLPSWLVLITMTSCGMAIVANFRESCTRVPCDDSKDLVCNRNSICECKMDGLNHAPWVFIERMDKCIPVLRDDQHIHSGNNNPAIPDSERGFGNSPRCTSLNAHCSYTSTCQSNFGNLASCKLHPYNSAENRCQCCHPSQETGYYNDKCHFVKRIGESCDNNEQCILGSSNSECKRGVCSYSYNNGGGGHHGGNNGGGGGQHGGNNPYGDRYNAGFCTSGYISMTLIMATSLFALSS